RQDTLYGRDNEYSLRSNGNLGEQLATAIRRLPEFAPTQSSPVPARDASAPGFVPPPPLRHIGEGSFFVGDDRIIYQSEDGKSVPVVYGGTLLRSGGTMTGKRLASLIGLRDKA